MNWQHIPVLLNETLNALITGKDGVYVDGTLGLGGHSLEILKNLSPKGRLVSFDLDLEACNMASQKLAGYPNFTAINRNYSEAAQTLEQMALPKATGALFDLGLSSYQLDNPSRGFSFLRNGPLDMRFNMQQKNSAFDFVNSLDERELADILYKYADEYKSRAVARAIARAREEAPISDTKTLAEIVQKATGRHGRTHGATKTFQALRIAVNGELNNLEKLLASLGALIAPKGRCAFITFHSIEDRLVKHAFKAMEQSGAWRLLAKKPISAGDEEIKNNPRSRSAKLRVIEKV